MSFPPKLITSENKKFPLEKIEREVLVAPISRTTAPKSNSLSFKTAIPEARPEKIPVLYQHYI